MKEDIAADPIYREIALRTLCHMHGRLLTSLSEFFQGKEGKHTLVIAGQGPEAIPYSNHLEHVAKMIGDGNIAMFDYNASIVESSFDALFRPTSGRGIDTYGFTGVEADNDTVLHLRKQGERKIIVRQGDLSNKFAFEDNSVSAFEATLSIHHVTAYVQGLDHVISEVHRILEPNGLFHWGTGKVDMRYQEEKIHQLASLVCDFYSASVVVEDRRDPNTGSEAIIARALYHYGETSDVVPLVNENEYNQHVDTSLIIRITKDGFVVIDDRSYRKTNQLKAHLQLEGYKQVWVNNDGIVVVPLIDQGMYKDRDNFLHSVNQYYKQIMDCNQKNFADSPELAKRVLAADQKEYSDAVRGLFEYYTDPQLIGIKLLDHGFTDVTITSTIKDPWCNITAVKDGE